MKFWDASALVSLVVTEPHTKVMRKTARQDGALAVWWGSLMECFSAFARLRREGNVSTAEEDGLRRALLLLAGTWTEVLPSEDLRTVAAQLLLRHPLRAADSFQLAAAILWSGKSPTDTEFVCLDDRLSEAARREGFTIVPSSAVR
jgi:predicted nucleic acid-binding protein